MAAKTDTDTYTTDITATVRSIPIDKIVVPGHRLRPLQPAKVDELAASIASLGQLQPSVVSRAGDDYVVIAGVHRVEANRKLEHDRICAVIVDAVDADTAQLAEIDENLVRADLSPAERALHIGARKPLYEKLHPETKHGGTPGKTGGGKKAKGTKLGSFATETAKATGRSKTAVKRDVTRAKSVVVLDQISGTSLDKGDEIDALAKLPEDEQRQLAARAKAGEKVSAKPAENSAPKAAATKPPRKTKGTPPPPPDDDKRDDDAPTRWQRSLANAAGDAIALRAFWNRAFGNWWHEFKVPSDLVTLAKQAASAWTELAAELENRAAQRTEAAAAVPPPPPDDDPSLAKQGRAMTSATEISTTTTGT
jgi:hypothetical protein